MASTINSTAYETSRIIKTTPGALLMLVGYNSKATAQFIQLHDTAIAAAEGVAPMMTFTVNGVSNFSLDLPLHGLAFKTGIYVCNSSTGPTKSIGSADCYFTAQVEP